MASYGPMISNAEPATANAWIADVESRRQCTLCIVRGPWSTTGHVLLPAVAAVLRPQTRHVRLAPGSVRFVSVWIRTLRLDNAER